MAIPKDPPSCRIMPVKAAPSPISLPFKVESDKVVIGTNNNPNPIPLTTSGQNMFSAPVSGVINKYIHKLYKKKPPKPAAASIFCGTPRSKSLPIKGIIKPVVIELGISKSPASVAVQPNMDWV